MVFASLFNLGTRVRRMFLALPDAIHSEQPGCRAFAGHHFRHSAVWDMQPPQRAMRARALQRTSTPVSGKVVSLKPAMLLAPFKHLQDVLRLSTW